MGLRLGRTVVLGDCRRQRIELFTSDLFAVAAVDDLARLHVFLNGVELVIAGAALGHPVIYDSIGVSFLL